MRSQQSAVSNMLNWQQPTPTLADYIYTEKSLESQLSLFHLFDSTLLKNDVHNVSRWSVYRTE